MDLEIPEIREMEREFHGLGRRPRTDSASPRYGLPQHTPRYGLPQHHATVCLNLRSAYITRLNTHTPPGLQIP